MKIIIIGGKGLIGRSVVDLLKSNHEILVASRNNADILVDISDPSSIEDMYKKHKNVDAVIVTTGKVHFAPFDQISLQDYQFSIENKLLCQINVVTIGKRFLNDSGSFTLTSGILNRDPIESGSAAAMVNGGLDAFTKAAAIEMPRGLRINCVSPTVITEGLSNYGDYFKGYRSIDAKICALYYQKSVEGLQTGQVFNAE